MNKTTPQNAPNTDGLGASHSSFSLTTADPAAVAAAEAAKQRIQSAYIIAAHHPRNQEQARQNILKSCKRIRFAEKAKYEKPVGNNIITGPSVRFAETALREWGNILSDISVIYEDQQVRRIKVIITDLETNTSFTKELSIRKTVERKFARDREVISERLNSKNEKVFIVAATDDEIANKEAASISKAIRNEGLRLIPDDVVEEAMDIVAETIAKGISEDPDAHKRKMLDAFLELGIKAKDIEIYLNHSVDRISPSEIASLKSVYRTIRDGEARWEDYLTPSGAVNDEGGNAGSSIPKATVGAGGAANAMFQKGKGMKQAEKTEPEQGGEKKEEKAKTAAADHPVEEAKVEKPKEPESDPAVTAYSPQMKEKMVANIRARLKHAKLKESALILWGAENQFYDADVKVLIQIQPDVMEILIEQWDTIEAQLKEQAASDE